MGRLELLVRGGILLGGLILTAYLLICHPMSMPVLPPQPGWRELVGN